jgi:hypothetical protein
LLLHKKIRSPGRAAAGLSAGWSSLQIPERGFAGISSPVGPGKARFRLFPARAGGRTRLPAQAKHLAKSAISIT